MKKIEDYLPFYLGCETEVFEEDEPFIKRRILTAENLDNTIHWGEKPYLRPLSDMTEEEGIEILSRLYKHLFDLDAAFSDIEIVRDRSNINKFGIIVSEENYKEKIGMMLDPFRGFEMSIEGQMMNVPQAEIFHILLSKHFDLFNLIEAGLAIEYPPNKKYK